MLDEPDMTEENTQMFIVGDWGTSQLRMFLCRRNEKNGLSVLDKITGPGVSACSGKLEETLLKLIETWVLEYGKLSIVLSGMVGSNIGWVETPYLECPANVRDLAKARVQFMADGHNVSIIPGLACINPMGVPDVMRGEEMQVLGWMMTDEKHSSGSYLICLPGTHTKWVLVKDGYLELFWTSLTGELFALLKEHSVLLADRDAQIKDEVFIDAVKSILKIGPENILSGLFGVRSQQIRAGMPKEDAMSYLSGYLIGTDICSAKKLMIEAVPDLKKVILIGEPKISKLFSLALSQCGYKSEITHATDIFLEGFRNFDLLSSEVKDLK
jgi:2-dehydro-3-deoxygalactonokinase